MIYVVLGPGMAELSLADRATIANMSPEYGATMGFFPVDHVTLEYLKLTGRSDDTVSPLYSISKFSGIISEYFQGKNLYSDMTWLPCYVCRWR